MFWDDIKRIKEKLNTICSRMTDIQVKLDVVIQDNDSRRAEEVELATKTLDKFDDYMKNVDKLNALINEFKGCVSMARGSLEERKRISDNESETVKIMLKIAEILQKHEKKSRKPRKSVQSKKTASPASLSQ